MRAVGSRDESHRGHRGPRPCMADVPVFDPVRQMDFTRWRLDLAIQKRFAVGHDEMATALQNMQMLVGDVDVLPPLLFNHALCQLETIDRKPAQLPQPSDVALAVLADGHWVSFVILEAMGLEETWLATATGIDEDADMSDWLVALASFIGRPKEKFHLGKKRSSEIAFIEDGCGFEALLNIASQLQHEWQWKPMAWRALTGNMELDGLICGHLRSLQSELQSKGASNCIIDFVLSIRALFLKMANHLVIQREIMFGHGLTL